MRREPQVRIGLRTLLATVAWIACAFLSAVQAQALPPAAAEALGQAQRGAASALIEYTNHAPDRPLWAEALRLGRTAAAAAPTHPAPQRFLAQAYQQVGFYARAWEAWTAYRAFGGTLDVVAERNLIEVARWMGVAAYDGGRQAEAIPYFETLIEFLPFDPIANERLARTYLAQGVPLRSRPYLEALDGTIPDLADELAYVRRLDLYGDVAAQAFEAGLAAAAAGDASTALARYTDATSAAPGFVDAWREVVDTALALGREGVATQALDQLLALAPDDPAGRAARAALAQAEAARIAAEEAAAAQEQAASEAAAQAEAARLAAEQEAAQAEAARLAAEREAAQAEAARLAAEREAAQAAADQAAAAAAEAQAAAAAEERTAQDTAEEAAARAAAAAEAARATAAAAAEADAARAAEAEAARLAAEQEAARAVQAEADRLAAEQEAARLAAEEEAARAAAAAESEAAARAAAERNAQLAGAAYLTLGDASHLHGADSGAANAAVAYVAASDLLGDLSTRVGDVLHVRVIVSERPSDDPMWFQLCLVPPDVSVAPACSATDLLVLRALGTYETSIPWSALGGAGTVDWRRGVVAIMWVLRRPDGTPVMARDADADRYLPTTLRVRVIAAPSGAALPTGI